MALRRSRTSSYPAVRRVARSTRSCSSDWTSDDRRPVSSCCKRRRASGSSPASAAPDRAVISRTVSSRSSMRSTPRPVRASAVASVRRLWTSRWGSSPSCDRPPELCLDRWRRRLEVRIAALGSLRRATGLPRGRKQATAPRASVAPANASAAFSRLPTIWSVRFAHAGRAAQQRLDVFGEGGRGRRSGAPRGPIARDTRRRTMRPSRVGLVPRRRGRWPLAAR